MYYSIVLFVASRYIYSKTIDRFSQCIYWVSSISVMLSITIMIIILSVMNGFERELKQNLLYLIPHVIVTSATGYVHISHIPDFLSNKILKDIAYIKPLIISNVLLQSSKKISLGVMLGINPNHFEPLSNYLINHNINQLISGKYYIIIGSALAQQLSVNINDQIRLTIPSINQITPIGYFPSQRLFTILDIYISNDEMDNSQILVHQDDAAKLMHYPAQCITGWRIWLYDPFNLNKFNQLKISKDWIWKDWTEYKGSLFQAIKIEKKIMFLLFTLIIIISGFNIISFLVLLITEKQKEVAILKTYGFNRFQIVMLFMIQGISNGIFGITWGTGLGILLSTKFNQILFFLNIFTKTLQFPIEIQYFQILSINLIVFILIILTVLYPSWCVASIHPAQVLRNAYKI